MAKELTQKEKDLIKKYESPNRLKNKPTKEDYLKQTDRNYKDGDRN
jgi:hypothetical protein